jgi:hypothetical protein
MSAKVKFSTEYKKKKERIKKLPQMGYQVMMGLTKTQGAKFIKIFHDGIAQNKFGLMALAESTIYAKKRLGYGKPNTPLLGKGDREKKKSYVNMLRLKQLKNGWKVFPSWGKHHKANLELRQLLKIHEEGRTIKRNNSLIRIPPRPAFLLSQDKFMKERRREIDNKRIKKEITNYLNVGFSKWFNEMIKAYYGLEKDKVE